jgi:diguanylate cyclase (GGDEF)-like protein
VAVTHARPAGSLTAVHKSLLISAALGLGAVGLLILRGDAAAPLALHVPGPAIAIGLTALFLLGDYVLLNVEFRRQAYTFTLAGVPLALGMMLAVPLTFVAARLIGSAIVLVIQRVAPVKVAYNLSAYMFEAALAATTAGILIGHPEHLGPLVAAGFGVVLLAGDFLMTCLVLGMIRIHNGPLKRSDAIEVFVQTVCLCIASTSFAMVVVLLIKQGVLGVVLVVILTVGLAVAYHAYIGMSRRHKSLALVHEFVTGSVGAESVETLGEQLLNRIRTLLNAASAELVIFDDVDGGSQQKPPASSSALPAETTTLVLSIAEDEKLQVRRSVLDRSDWLTSRVVSQEDSIVAGRNTKDPGLRRWLEDHGHRDAMIVPLLIPNQLTGVLTLADRLGDTRTFVAEDLTTLQTLTGHLAIAIRGARLVQRLAYDATHDALTGLANRSFLTHRLRDILATTGDSVAVMLLDLDAFKEVNDALGHHVGDQLLQVVAERLTTALPSDSTIARLGGDEFAVLLPNIAYGPAAGGQVAEQIWTALVRPVHLDEAVLTPDASIGVAIGSATDRTADLLRQADTAMYAAKTSGDNVVVYSPELDRGRAERLALLADLRAALDSAPEQLVLHYQPKIDLVSGEVTGVEALVRWHHPTLGILAPGAFIPAAESTGLIERLTPHVIQQALADCRRWLDRGHDISVAVNISARNLSDRELPVRIRGALARAGVPAEQLVLEITESSVVGDPEQTLPTLRQLAGLGLCLSLDDFGTGYSSLSYLQRLPVHEVKIDRSFVQGLSSGDSENSRALIRSIAGLGANLCLRVVAEGVEHVELLTELRDLGCHVAQGYYISRPLPMDNLTVWPSNLRTNAFPRLQLVTDAVRTSSG